MRAQTATESIVIFAIVLTICGIIFTYYTSVSTAATSTVSNAQITAMQDNLRQLIIKANTMGAGSIIPLTIHFPLNHINTTFVSVTNGTAIRSYYYSGTRITFSDTFVGVNASGIILTNDTQIYVINNRFSVLINSSVGISDIPSRYPPVGGGNSSTPAFSPSDIVGLRLWLDASSINASDGDAIATWLDNSTFGNNVSQSTVGSRPTYQTNEVNGLPVVRFDGVNDYLNKTISLAQPDTVFIVTKGNGRVLDSTSSRQLISVNNNSAKTDMYGGSGGITGFGVGDSFSIISAIFNGASSQLYVQGNLLASGSIGTDAISNLLLGYDMFSSYYAGDIAEVIIYNSSLSTTNRSSIEAYLADKYAITLGAFSAPTNTSGLRAWYKADALSLSNNSNITSWNDSSGHKLHMAQSTESFKPKYITNQINSLPVVQFDGSNDYLIRNLVTQSQPDTIFVVTKGLGRTFDASGGGRQLLDINSSSGSHGMYSGAYIFGNATANQYNVITTMFNGSSSNMYSNGNVIATGNTSTDAITNFIFGWDGGGAVYFNGTIAEILLYNGGLDSSNRSAIESYLMTKYNISDPNTTLNITDGLVAYYKFDEGGGLQALDSAGSYTGNLSNAPDRVTGQIGDALRFNVTRNNSVYTSFDQALGNFSAGMWFKPRGSINNIANERLLDKNSNTGFWMGHDATETTNNTRWGGGIRSIDDANFFYTTINPLQWNHLMLVRNGSLQLLYVNGVMVANRTGAANVTDSTKLSMAKSSEYLTADMDEVRIYNRTLSAAEIALVYAFNASVTTTPRPAQKTAWYKFDDGSGAVALDAVNNYTANVTNSPTWTTGIIGGALQFTNTSSQRVQIPAVAFSNYPTSGTTNVWASSFSIWFKTNQSGVILGQSAGGGYVPSIYIGTDNKLHATYIWHGAVDRQYTSTVNYTDNAWHHVVVTYNNGYESVYVDGTHMDTRQYNQAAYDTSFSYHLGYSDTNTWPSTTNNPTYYTGLLDDVIIYNGSLTAAEVSELYANGSTGLVNVTYGLLANWTFNEGSGLMAYDYSGKGNNGTLNNGVTWISSPRGGALLFDGTDDYLNTSTDYSASLWPAGYAYSFWFNTSSASGKKMIGVENAQNGGGTTFDRHVYMGTNGKVYFGNYPGSHTYARSIGTYNDSQWHHVVAMSNYSYYSLYVDGVLQETTAGGSQGHSPAYVKMGGIAMGSWANSSAGYFPGMLDDIKIYNRTLNSSEILNLNSSAYSPENIVSGLVGQWKFDDGSGSIALDTSGYGRNGTLSNTPSWISGKKNNALSFTTGNQNVSVLDTADYSGATGKNFSVFLWVYPNALTGTNQDNFNPFITKYLSINDKDWGLGNVNNKLFFGYESSGNQWDTDTGVGAATGTLGVGQWQHVGFTIANGSYVVLYLNGTNVTSFTLPTAIPDTSANIEIGSGNYKNIFLNGTVDEVRIYNRTLNSSEINAVYRIDS